MDFRERLLRTDIRHLAENLRTLSEEFMLFQDFIKHEFEEKLTAFVELRKISKPPDQKSASPPSKNLSTTSPVTTNTRTEGSQLKPNKSGGRRSKTKSKKSTVTTRLEPEVEKNDKDGLRRSSRRKSSIVYNYNLVSDEDGDSTGIFDLPTLDNVDATDVNDIFDVQGIETKTMDLDNTDNSVKIASTSSSNCNQEINFVNSNPEISTVDTHINNVKMEIDNNEADELDEEFELDPTEFLAVEKLESGSGTNDSNSSSIPTSQTEASPLIRSCPVCLLTLQQHDLLIHIQEHTEEETDTGLLCRTCGRQFLNPSVFNRHKSLGHDLTRKRYSGNAKCQYCGMICRDRSRLKDHERTHTKEKPFDCPICHKKFVRKDIVSRHIKDIHTADKKDYRERLEQIYSRRVKNEKNHYDCEICLKSFNRSDSLTRHAKLHTREMLLTCPQCDYTSARADHIKLHISRTHTDDGGGDNNDEQEISTSL